MKRLLVICVAVVLALGLAIVAFPALPTMSQPPAEPIEATVDFYPDTLNLGSEGEWIPCYIELPEGYDVEEIDISSVTLKLKFTDTVPALAHPTKVGDYDSDEVPDLMVKFERAAVQGILPTGGEVKVTVSGELTDGTPFEGRDMIGAMTGYVGKSTIINRFGLEDSLHEGFLEEKASGLKVLHLKGTAYERGYQRGMLQEDLAFVTSSNIMELAGWFGWGDGFEAGLEMVREAKELMEPYIPYQFRQEMQGMADALAYQGFSITYDDIVLHMVGADFGMMDPWKHDLTQSPERSAFPPITRCSTFSAWGDATEDGSLIIAANSDYYDTEEELLNRLIVVVDPTDGGYGYVGVLWDVFPVAAGINEAGIAINGHLVSADEESLLGVSSELLMAMVLQYADSIEDAVEILTAYPRTCGIIIHIADGKTNRSAVIEYTADHIAVVSAEPGRDVLWNTNHFNAYPGWKGYEGFNMVTTQDVRGRLKHIKTIEKWQASLADGGKGTAGRYGRYEELLDENYGEITVEIAKEIITDRYDVNAERVLGPTETSPSGYYTIAVVWDDWVVFEDIDYYHFDRSGEVVAKQGNVGSYVAVPATGDIWWSVGVPPSAYTAGYKYLNLFEELASNR